MLYILVIIAIWAPQGVPQATMNTDTSLHFTNAAACSAALAQMKPAYANIDAGRSFCLAVRTSDLH